MKTPKHRAPGYMQAVQQLYATPTRGQATDIEHDELRSVIMAGMAFDYRARLFALAKIGVHPDDPLRVRLAMFYDLHLKGWESDVVINGSRYS